MADSGLDALVQSLLSRQIVTGRASNRQQPEGIKGIQMGKGMEVLDLGSPTPGLYHIQVGRDQFLHNGKTFIGPDPRIVKDPGVRDRVISLMQKQSKMDEDYARREKQLNQARDMLRAMHGPDKDLVIREMLELKAKKEAGTK